jgi:predicted ATPase/DNA-binding winged helix-turn-helix (wHTH) protein
MVQIGKLHVNFDEREVCQDGSPLRIGARAFGILALLIEADGALVSKDEIMSRVWPDTIVEENNLQVQVAVLRKALGDDRAMIRTVPGRGYRLIAQPPAARPDAFASPPIEHRTLPASPPPLVGRDADAAAIAAALGNAPVLTLAGAGGIGKTSLAIRVARELGARFRDGVRFVELAALQERDAVLRAVRDACGLRRDGSIGSVGDINVNGDDSDGVARIAAALAGRDCLVVFDNAEHVVDVVATLASALVDDNAALRVLVTSREPLRIPCESVFRVQPLDVPGPDASPDDARACSAVALFLRRAHAMGCDLVADAASVTLVGEICRRLDGIPLAIELAASRAAALGVRGVYERLDDRLQLLGGGSRTALPRHQTLRATFDWSYALLDPTARTVFRRVGVFAGAFAFEAIRAVAADPETTSASVIATISELTAKSLLNVEFDGAVATYRLAESTRAYALEKLRDEGETARIAMRHMQFLEPRLDGARIEPARHARAASIASAQRQGARMLELQASLTLARLWRDAGRVADARVLLGGLRAHFDPASRATDIVALYALLDELEPRR